jgi:hypothetical protein
MKSTISLSLLLLCSIVVVSCSSFRNGAPPTKTEQALFTVTTNYVPSVVTVTNPPTAPGQPPTVTTTTNLTPTYTWAPGKGIADAQAVASLIPGYGSLAGMGIGALAAIWGWIRSSKNGTTAATLAQSIETIREFVKTLPNGAVYDNTLTTWLTQHQAETGTVDSVLALLENDVSNPDAIVAAQQLRATIASLNPSALPPKPPGT